MIEDELKLEVHLHRQFKKNKMVGNLVLNLTQFSGIDSPDPTEMGQYIFSNTKSSWTGSILLSVLVIGPTPQNVVSEDRGLRQIPNIGSRISIGRDSFTDSNNRRYYINHGTEQLSREPPIQFFLDPEISSVSSSQAYPNRVQITVDSSAEPELLGVNENLEGPSLPRGWTSCRTSDDRIFFIDHISKNTTWSDPRGTLSPANSPVISSLLISSNERAVDRLADLGPFDPGWERRVHRNGRIFYIDHIHRKTQWDDPRLESLAQSNVKFSSNYKKKYLNFLANLRKPLYTSPRYEFTVRRNNLFEDSYRSIMIDAKNRNLLRSHLLIKFSGEVGIDYGGVAREWFYLISREIFNPYYGLFEYSAVDSYSLQVSPMSHVANEDDSNLFFFAGVILGMAAYHRRLVDVCFVKPFYKLLTERSILLEDLATVDHDYYNSLIYVKDNDPSDLLLDFTISESRFGKMIVHNLVPHGNKVFVTQQNKHKYINAVVNWRVVERVKRQMGYIRRGFSELIPLNSISIFDPSELEYLLSGIPVIDVNDWKLNTTYKNGYNINHPVIVNFWKALYSLDSEMQGRLLQFVTGTSRVPMNGFAELQGSNGIQMFNIEKWGTTNQFPRSHTCFNRLDLPPYEDYKYIRAMLIAAIENCEGFGGVD